MSNTYSLTFVNNSANNWDFCCFQKDPDITIPNVVSLAWFAFPVAPTTRVKFSWTIDYQFVWSQTGRLAPGVLFSASQHWDADLTTQNGVDFTRLPNTSFTFDKQRKFGQPGTLYINQDGTIPKDAAAVGINMAIKGSPQGAGSGTFVVPSQPNIPVSFTPHPSYWVAFGQYAPGQVLDTQQTTQAAQVEFEPAVFDMFAILNRDNTWTITSQLALNTAFLGASNKEKVPHALATPVELLR